VREGCERVLHYWTGDENYLQKDSLHCHLSPCCLVEAGDPGFLDKIVVDDSDQLWGQIRGQAWSGLVFVGEQDHCKEEELQWRTRIL